MFSTKLTTPVLKSSSASLITTTTTTLRRGLTHKASQWSTTHQYQHQTHFTKSTSRHAPRTPITTATPTTPNRPTTTQQRRQNSSRRQNDEDDDGDMPMPTKGGQKEQKGSLGPRPQQIEAETHRYGSTAVLPEHLRGKGFTFRKGLAVPKLNNNHWLNKLVIEPYIAMKGNMLVWWDTQIRFTKLGFVMLHVSSLIAAGLLSWKAQDYYWVDYEDNMDRARHLYMIDVARLLWLQTATQRCELVIQQRKNGIIPGLLVPEALRSEKESPFRTTSYRYQHDISDRIEKWKDEYGQEEEMKKRFRREMWGDKGLDEIDQLKQRQDRQEELKRVKLGSRPEYDQRLQDTNDDIRERLKEQKGGFRDKYINSRLKVE